MISDFHRNLLQGGIYYYPGDLRKPEGKIRLLLEAQALAFIAEQAGGYASDGIGSVLDLQPHHLHQRTPLFIGSRSLVDNRRELHPRLRSGLDRPLPRLPRPQSYLA